MRLCRRVRPNNLIRADCVSFGSWGHSCVYSTGEFAPSIPEALFVWGMDINKYPPINRIFVVLISAVVLSGQRPANQSALPFISATKQLQWPGMPGLRSCVTLRDVQFVAIRILNFQANTPANFRKAPWQMRAYLRGRLSVVPSLTTCVPSVSSTQRAPEGFR